MIDIIKAKKVFKEYIKNYDINDPKIQLKISHIERTSEISGEIAKSLKLSNGDIMLAELIGLLHDIGRFEQIKIYNTFIDKKSINHAEFGVKILFEDKLIEKFIDTRDYDEIIKKAILNHNKSIIDNDLNEKELLHTKIIRDADKTDILYILTFDKIETLYGVDDLSNQKISDEIYREFIEDKKINYTNIENEVDLLVAHFAYLYDFNFSYGLEIIKEKGYLEKMFNRHSFKDQITMNRYEKIYELATKYIENNN